MRFAARGGRRPTRRLARGDSIRRRVYRTTTTTERRARAVVVTARRPARTSVPPVERVRAIYFRGARCARVGGFFKPALEVYAFRSFTPTSLSHNIKGRRGFPPRLAPPPPLTHTVPCHAHLSRGQTNRPPLSFSSLEETSGVFVVVRTSSREGKNSISPPEANTRPSTRPASPSRKRPASSPHPSSPRSPRTSPRAAPGRPCPGSRCPRRGRRRSCRPQSACPRATSCGLR